MQKKAKVGIVCCSNGLSVTINPQLQQLKEFLIDKGIEPVFSAYVFKQKDMQAGTAKERAKALLQFYEDEKIDAILDLSGGDIANEILPYLDYEQIAKAKNTQGNPKMLWGYSDLTVLLNAIYTKTGNCGVLYQARFLLEHRKEKWTKHLVDWLVEDDYTESGENLFTCSYEFIQGTTLSGIVVGGNIRCLLKLAGTEYFPDMTDKVLLLEARSGLEPQLRTYFAQLKQMGVFEKISGILLGTFTQFEQQKEGQMKIVQLVKEVAGNKLPIVKTKDIGHALDAKAIRIGKRINLNEGRKR